MELEGRGAIVTGGGTGIGAGVARALAEAGAHVTVCGRRQAPLANIVDELLKAGGEAQAVQADVSQVADVQDLVDRALASGHPIDILVNNAGVRGGQPIHRHDPDEWDRVLSVNLKGPFLTARYALPHMRARGGGHIVNISSEAGLAYYEGNGAYGVSKHALNALGEYIQRENQGRGIRVDTICPGMVITEMTADRPGLDHEKSLQPQDIADLVLWLVSRRPNIKIGRPVLIQTMLNPWT